MDADTLLGKLVTLRPKAEAFHRKYKGQPRMRLLEAEHWLFAENLQKAAYQIGRAEDEMLRYELYEMANALYHDPLRRHHYLALRVAIDQKDYDAAMKILLE